MITVGLDFGTHQSKICIEERNGAETSYHFYPFIDCNNQIKYTIPSIIAVGHDNRLTYGYIPTKNISKVVKYFKQATFCPSYNQMPQCNAIYFSCWFLAYIIFDLEEFYGKDFTIQMGVPTDSEHFDQAKHLATRLVASAYFLVENVFNNDKELFLNSTIQDLVKKTTILKYSKSLKEEYGMLVFPEAYACLMPLVKSAKIPAGMSLMIDIGGGTTDISFFTIENQAPQIYSFHSINRGLNFLTDVDNLKAKRPILSNITDSDILKTRITILTEDIDLVRTTILQKLQKEFSLQSDLPSSRLWNALKNRPIIYSGGGSTFGLLCNKFPIFDDIVNISEREWDTKNISDFKNIKKLNLCPILSTAYGLSISVVDDNIKCVPFSDIFENIRGQKFDSINQNFDYMADYDAWK